MGHNSMHKINEHTISVQIENDLIRAFIDHHKHGNRFDFGGVDVG